MRQSRTERAEVAATRPRPLLTGIVAAGALLGALAVLAIVLLVLVLNQPDVERVDDHAPFSRFEHGALVAARREVVTLTTLTPSTARTQVRRVLDDATGSFRSELARIAGQLERTVVTAQVTTRGRIVGSGVQATDVDRQTVTVLIAASQAVRDSQAAQGPRQYRMTVTMERTATGKWLVAGLVLVP